MAYNVINKDIHLIRNEEIIEWDIRSANTSIMRYYNLAPDSIISEFSKMKKDKRTEAVGKYMRMNPDFGAKLEKGFSDIVDLFIMENKLDIDKDIVGIARDAVFVRNKPIRYHTFGNVEFTNKNSYQNYLYLPRYRFFLNKDTIDVKGIGDESLQYHQNGVLTFIRASLEASSNVRTSILFLKDYASMYKKRELIYDAYREFNGDSKYRVNLFGSEVLLDDIDDDLLECTNISYNYIYIYMETLKVLMTEL